MRDSKIIRQVLEQNEKGLKRLADEEPAAERRSKLKRLKRKVKSLFEHEEKIGYISA